MKIIKLNAFLYLSFEGADFCLRQGRKAKECCRIANFSDAVLVKICPSKPNEVWMSSRSAHIHSARICIEVRPSGLNYSMTSKLAPPFLPSVTEISPLQRVRIFLTRARPKPLPSDLWELSL